MTRVPWVPGAVWASGALAAAALTLALCDGEPPGRYAPASSRATRGATPAVSAARRLSERSTSLLRQLYPSLTARQARALARRRMRRIPLPAGGSFTGIRWEQAVGLLTPGEVELTLQYNARCQWLRAERDGRELGTASGVVGLTRKWPALREVAGRLPRSKELADCDASHVREVAFAQSRGVLPSS